MSDGKSSKGVMQRLEMSIDRQLLAGMVARAVGLTMLTEVGDVWADRRHDPADSGMVARDHVAPDGLAGGMSLSFHCPLRALSLHNLSRIA